MEIISQRSMPLSGAAKGTYGPRLVRLAGLIGAFLAAYFVVTNWDRWAGEAATQSTDDAYLSADLTPMGTRVQGLVEAVPVEDLQHVHQGDLLVQIRDDDYRAQVILAEADVAAAKEQLVNVLAQRRLQQANITASQTAVIITEGRC